MSSYSDQILTATALIAGFMVPPATGFAESADDRPNVLFIAVDDLRPELACYGASHIHSPNMDQLAASGTRFDRAYCNLPVCGPSRACLMTGLRATSDRFIKRTARADVDAPDAIPLHTHFKRHGYYAVSNGKIFDQAKDHEAGWSEPPWKANGSRFFDCYVLPESLEAERFHKKEPVLTRGKHRGPAYEAADVPDNAYTDGMTAERAIDDMRRLAKKNQPFFMAVGFVRPHLPFIAPKRYWDLYNFDEIQLPENYILPVDAPAAADRDWNELRVYSGIPPLPGQPVPDETARHLIHGYYACVSYVDALVGKLLDEIQQLGLEDNTIIVLWGDHGFNLGEHGMWCKHTPFDTNMQIPLLLRAPGMPDGVESPNLTESIDIYPTLCELTGLPLPDHLEGESLVPALRNDDKTAGQDPALGRMYSSETIRTIQHRYTEYFNKKTGDFTGRMLYDHDIDPDETVNIAEHPENRKQVEKLSEQLHESLPDGHPLKE